MSLFYNADRFSLKRVNIYDKHRKKEKKRNRRNKEQTSEILNVQENQIALALLRILTTKPNIKQIIIILIIITLETIMISRPTVLKFLSINRSPENDIYMSNNK